ncbi:MAG: C25 family cysteine peptidase [Bacteroidota bacterium]|nr:C25 family cysteine peptidase [Bacteroidota bacterium]
MRSILHCFSLFTLLLLFAFINASGQRLSGTEWIVESQKYYKISIGEDGIYKVDRNILQSSGIPVSSIDPRQYQVFFRGVEITIHIEGEADGSFDAADHIEFWGQRNDGTMDSVLFNSPDDLGQPFVSLFTDTSSYFLTWGPGKSNKRFKNAGFPTGITNPIAEPTYMAELTAYQSTLYYDGEPADPHNKIYTPDYNEGEGWLSRRIEPGSPLTFTFNTDGYAAGAGLPEIEFVIYGKSITTKSINHRLVVEANNGLSKVITLIDTSYGGYQTIRFKKKIPDFDLSGTLMITISSKGIPGSPSDVHAVSYVRVKYPRYFNDKPTVPHRFSYSGGNDTANYFAFPNWVSTAQPRLIMLDLTRGTRTEAHYIADVPHFYSSRSLVKSNYIIYDPSVSRPVTAMEPIDFKPISDYLAGYNFIIVTHKKLAASADEYAVYKETQTLDTTGNFKPLVVYADDLYNRFFYGLHHPAAIQNFLAYVYNNSIEKPAYVMLIGKGWIADNLKTPSYYATDLVPLVGYPTSDLMYVTGIDNNFRGRDQTLTPPMPIGRISAAEDQDVRNYLAKLKEYDAAGNDLWHKHAIHVSGGANIQEIAMNKADIIEAIEVIEGPFTGCETSNYLSDQTQAVVKNLENAIQGSIEEGASLLTYLGHGSANTLGVSFGPLDSLNNKGKYPIINLFGCSVGSPGYGASMADDWLFAKDKGAINWIAHTSGTFQTLVAYQMDLLYNNIAKDNYGEPIGEAWKHSIGDMHDTSGKLSNQIYRAIALQWLLQGDPSVKMFFQPLPDYTIDANKVHITPEDVTAYGDSFALGIPVINLGKAVNDSLKVWVRHRLPNQTIQTDYDTLTFTPVLHSDTLYYYIRASEINVAGANRFEIFLDAGDEIREMKEDNNTLEFEYLIPGTGANSLYPMDFGIEATNTPELLIQSRDLFDNNARAYFEIDTVPHFNSPFRMSSGLVQGTNIVVWQPQLPTKDSTAYYWRSRLDLPSDSGGSWVTRTFTYINGSEEGWSQSHYGQYRSIDLENAVYDTITNVFNFRPNYLQVGITANAFRNSGMGISYPGRGILNPFVCGTSTMVMVELDGFTLDFFDLGYMKTWFYNPCKPKPVGCTTCDSTEHYRQFNMREPSERARFRDTVDRIKEGNFILLFSRNPIQEFYEFEESTFLAFDKIGATFARGINRDSTAYVFVGRKGAIKGQTIEQDTQYDSTVPFYENDVLEIKPILEGKDKNGYISSPLIGPSVQWKSLHMEFNSLETNSKDYYHIEVYGVDRNGNEVLIFDSVKTSGFDLSSLDAQEYPFMKLRAYMQDAGRRTAPQLGLWKVLFEGVPEGTIETTAASRFENDTVNAGDIAHVGVRFKNISKHSMDSVLVRVKLYSNNTLISSKDSFYAPLNAGESFEIDYEVNTRATDGETRVEILVNPEYQQPELTLDNNTLRARLFINTDNVNPVMDVTFDGRHIRNGEIVSARPEIRVMVADENKHLALNDTALFQIWLHYPGESTARQIHFSNPEVDFIPGTVDTNRAIILFKPSHLPDGEYIFIAQAYDRSGNASGQESYSVRFRVMNEAKASNFYVYPNPFTFDTKFTFVFTGDEAPDEIVIRITGADGRVVRVIGNAEMGELHVGYNEYVWDGTGGNGQPLATGVYMYTVLVRNNGEVYGRYLLPQDALFDKTYGKLLIIR